MSYSNISVQQNTIDCIAKIFENEKSKTTPSISSQRGFEFI